MVFLRRQPLIVRALGCLLLSLAGYTPALAAENVVANLAKTFRDSDDYIQKTTKETKLWYCEYIPDAGERVESNARSVETNGPRTAKTIVSNQIEKLKADFLGSAAATPRADLTGVTNGVNTNAIPLSGDVFRIMYQTRSYGQEIRKKFEEFTAPLELAAAAPIQTSTGVDDFDCQVDFPNLSSQIDRRKELHTRLADNYHYEGLLQLVEYRIRDYHKALDRKQFLDFDRCQGVKEAMQGIDSALNKEKQALKDLIQYNKDKAQDLTTFSQTLKTEQANCQSIVPTS